MPKLPGKHQLTKEVSIVLIFKLLFLFLLWALCFSSPPAKHINDQQFANHLLSNTPRESLNDT